MSSFTQMMSLMSGAQSAISLLGSSLAVDVVRITDELGNQMFASARAMRAAVDRSSELCEHPLETGNTIADFKVIKPNVAQLAVFIPSDAYGSAYKEIEQAYINSTSMIVQTRASTFANMVITDMPHDESPDLGDIVAISITLKEVFWFTSSVETMPAKEVAANKKTGAKSDASTVKQGQKAASEATPATQDKYKSLSSQMVDKVLG